MDIVTHAKLYNLYLHVTITVGKENKSFKLNERQFCNMLKRYQTYYNTRIVFQSFNDYEKTIRLANGIQFYIILY